MTLDEWAKCRRRSLFDVDFYTIARAYYPAQGRMRGFVVFTNPLPFFVRVVRTVGEVAEILGRDAKEIEGRVYTEQDALGHYY